jgi:hypothetical protein
MDGQEGSGGFFFGKDSNASPSHTHTLDAATGWVSILGVFESL